MPDLLRAAAARIGRDAAFSFLPFPEAVARARAARGLLIAPLGREPSREGDFTWVAPLLDVPQVMGTLGTAVDLDDARRLSRIAVPRGGVQERFLRDRGFENLLPVEEAHEAACALAEGRAQAWYATASQIAWEMAALGHAARLGPPVVTATAWLAASPDPGDLPLAALREALAAMAAEGAVDRAWRAYVPG
ncbi:substrate-binding periplasmic protein [Roseomonas sp. CCTCC AB2023176]|uniref:substrate-binding periplasmic protein n=1 Tax=Roseomonas sp. CCTCC AB2023176 TaxID=3342640 RepID=UPI0035D6581E